MQKNKQGLNRLKISQNFYLDEFHCKDGTLVPVEYHHNIFNIVKDLQMIRDFFGHPLHVTSAYRTKSHNRVVGGALTSFHLSGKAVDFKIHGFEPLQISHALHHLMLSGKITQGGIGVYNSFVHYDHRGMYSLFKML